jgi:hypothetical protein
MDAPSIALAVGSSLALAYAGWVASLVARADFYSKGQKTAQIFLAFLIPVLGAMVVHGLLRSHTARPTPSDRNFVPQKMPEPENVLGGAKWVDDA